MHNVNSVVNDPYILSKEYYSPNTSEKRKSDIEDIIRGQKSEEENTQETKRDAYKPLPPTFYEAKKLAESNGLDNFNYQEDTALQEDIQRNENQLKEERDKDENHVDTDAITEISDKLDLLKGQEAKAKIPYLIKQMAGLNPTDEAKIRELDKEIKQALSDIKRSEQYSITKYNPVKHEAFSNTIEKSSAEKLKTAILDHEKKYKNQDDNQDDNQKLPQEALDWARQEEPCLILNAQQNEALLKSLKILNLNEEEYKAIENDLSSGELNMSADGSTPFHEFAEKAISSARNKGLKTLNLTIGHGRTQHASLDIKSTAKILEARKEGIDISVKLTGGPDIERKGTENLEEMAVRIANHSSMANKAIKYSAYAVVGIPSAIFRTLWGMGTLSLFTQWNKISTDVESVYKPIRNQNAWAPFTSYNKTARNAVYLAVEKMRAQNPDVKKAIDSLMSKDNLNDKDIQQANQALEDQNLPANMFSMMSVKQYKNAKKDRGTDYNKDLKYRNEQLEKLCKTKGSGQKVFTARLSNTTQSEVNQEEKSQSQSPSPKTSQSPKTSL